jgi:glycosyl-4,4'-diaponeurosporenoate acyltransferase
LGIMQGDEPIMHSSLGVVHLKHKDRGSPPP